MYFNIFMDRTRGKSWPLAMFKKVPFKLINGAGWNFEMQETPHATSVGSMEGGAGGVGVYAVTEILVICRSTVTLFLKPFPLKLFFKS